MPKPNEQAQINFIIDCLRKGEQRGEILSKFGKKWESVARSSFDRRLSKAKEQLNTEMEAVNEKLKESIVIESESRKSAIMSQFERKEYLTKIATCKSDIKKFGNQFYQIMEHEDGRKEFINQADKLKAIAELNKMDGSYAAQKQEVTINKPIIIDWSGSEDNTNEETT